MAGGAFLRYLIAAALAVVLTSCAVDNLYASDSAPIHSPSASPAETTPAPVQQIQIIDGQVYVAIPVEGMPEDIN